MKPERIMKSVIPIIMAGIVAIYGVVVAVLISGRTKNGNLMDDFVNLGAGLAVGLSGFLRRYGDWHRGRCRCARYRPTTQTLRRNDSDFNFCRGTRALRAHYRPRHDVHIDY